MRQTCLALMLLVSACYAASSLAGDDEEAMVKKDLFIVITLQGLPCGEVVSFATTSEIDHVALCKDGNRYRVFLNDAGRVVVVKQ